MPYEIIAYIPVEADEPEIFKTYKEAKEEKEHLKFMQPENIYRIKLVKAKRRFKNGQRNQQRNQV